MTRYYIYKGLVAVGILFTAACCASCTDERTEGSSTPDNLKMNFTTRAGTVAEIIHSTRLFRFDTAGEYRGELYNITRDAPANTLSVSVETGTWELAMVADPDGTATLTSPTAANTMDNLPMYTYTPTIIGGKSSNAAELFFAHTTTPHITSGGTHQMNATLERAVAKVEIVFDEVTKNFNLSGTHRIKLHHVPSTLSWKGKLLPDAIAPDTLSAPLQAPVTLKNSTVNAGFLDSDTISFIIPAHQGNTAADTLKQQLAFSVSLERTEGGSYFIKNYTPVYSAPKANHILRLHVSVNDGVQIKPEVLEWHRVDLTASVGTAYSNWLYVKKGSTGTGTSWSDAEGSIAIALAKAAALKSAGSAVNGILVAGGSALVYDETLTIPQGIRVFGGWEGIPGTELPANDFDAPYTSGYRDLENHKAYISSQGVQLASAESVLDGFNLSLQGTAAYDGLLHVKHATAYANAIEIAGTSVPNGKYTLKLDAGTVTNILSAENSGSGVYVGVGGSLVNATIANDKGLILVGGTLRNSIVWHSAVTIASNYGASLIQNCALDYNLEPNAAICNAAIATDSIYKINTINNSWFTASNVMPGPFFAYNDSGAPLTSYKASTVAGYVGKAPMLGRGFAGYFNVATAAYMPLTAQTDINGKPREYMGMDIGCYESQGDKGFKMQWATDRLYVPYKATYESQQPLMIPGNDLYGIQVSWTASVAWNTATNNIWNGTGATMRNASGGAVLSVTGSSTIGNIVAGTLRFKNGGSTTPNHDYTGSTEVRLGSVTISTNLGSYLQNTSIDIYATPGNAVQWLNGYVGSFHRNREIGARYISAVNTGDWSARIISGLDWIKVDANDKDYGVNITDPDEGITPSGGYYKAVEQVWSGVVSGTGNIKFRVGMQSKNDADVPRYGMIIITRASGVSMFFVRQGETDDYLYREIDAKPTATYGDRTGYLVKFSTYNLTDPVGNTNTNGVNLGARGGRFVDYPSKLGYYFKWNQTIAHLSGTGKITTANQLTWDDNYEICPVGYRHGTHPEFINTLYYNVATSTNGGVSPAGADALKNYAWGAYADGWYDQRASDPMSESYLITENALLGTGKDFAMKGTLMVNHYNYASLFFPGAGTIDTSGYRYHTYYPEGGVNSSPAMYYTKTKSASYNYGTNTHWSAGHIGMNCTPIYDYCAAPVRCVKE